MPFPGRSSSTRRSSSIASPKCRKRPPLQVPIALRPGSLIAAGGSGLGVAVRGLAALVRVVLAAVLDLGPDPDLLRLGLLRWLFPRLLRGDDRQAQRFVLVVPGVIAVDRDGRPRSL